jgi:hypothetical protein
MLSGLTVSTGAAAPFPFAVEDASPEDDATRFPEQPPVAAKTPRHNSIKTALYGFARLNILHLL